MCALLGMLALASATDFAQAQGCQQDGNEPHQEEVDAVAFNGGNGSGICFMILLPKGFGLAGGEEEAT